MRPMDGPAARLGSISLLPVERLRESYVHLRPGALPPAPEQLTPLPIRVAARDDGTYEVIDGFKRLASWRALGHGEVPVTVEHAGDSTVEHKRLLLVANAPPRTLTALDEARVVVSLTEDDGLTPKAVARLLGRKPKWVARRLDIGSQLSAEAQRKLAQGRVGPTLAHALCALCAKDQDAVLGAIERHALKGREAPALVSAYRVADEVDRRALLRAPLELLRPKRAVSAGVSPRTVDLEQRLEQIREALVDLAAFSVPPELPPAEQRRLLARYRSVLAQLEATAAALLDRKSANTPSSQSEESHAASTESRAEAPVVDIVNVGDQQSAPPRRAPGNARRDRGPACPLRHEADRPPRGLVPQTRPPRAGGGGMLAPRASGEEQARPFHRADTDEGREGSHRQPHPAGDP